MRQPKCIEILKQLGRHFRDLDSRIYGPLDEKHQLEQTCSDAISGLERIDGPTLRSELDPGALKQLGRLDELDGYQVSDADDETYWGHPLFALCVLLEERTGIPREDLEETAWRLNTTIGLREWNPVTRPPWRDLLHVLPKLRELDNDGATKEIWIALVGNHKGVLRESGLLRGMKKDEANNRAMSLARADSEFVENCSVRKWAEAIGCSTGLVLKLPFYQQCSERADTSRKGKAKRPEIVALTKAVEARAGCEDKDLERLVAEQEGDFEPSPLAADPPDNPLKVRQHKRL
jgi:hypothetical protein